ncbi:hypothetical protein L6164_035826 [Bauhinia variegata]|uniref:Uncharacterized protein n=1 Tax=Bauhinia variegata TaxID=167791 RepID=A0ACB9KF69_BAUVA|nr:hypothetical protein L6164_035826 [Bauhinia variegata]
MASTIPPLVKTTPAIPSTATSSDVTGSTCRDCVSTAARQVVQRCPNETNVVIWCLQIVIANLDNCCSGKQGGRVLTPSCYIRSKIYPFYQAVASAPVPTPEMIPKGKIKTSARTIIAIVVPIGIVLVLLCCWYLNRRARRKYSAVPEHKVDISTAESVQFDLDTIKSATNNFCHENKLGEGGFGEVYKGKLPDGQYIAVKRLSSSSRQGAEQFKNEAWKLWREGRQLELLNPALKDSYSRDEAIRCIHIGLLLVQEDPDPRTTTQSILVMLESYTITLPAPHEPAFFAHARANSNMPQTEQLVDHSTSKSMPSSYEESASEFYPRQFFFPQMACVWFLKFFVLLSLISAC